MNNKNKGGGLTGKEIINAVSNGDIIIRPFLKEAVNPNSYNYHLGPTLKRIKNEVIDLNKEDDYELITIPKTGYKLMPNECYIGSTIETFNSDVYASLVTGRSSIGRKFITNHVTAGLIDQGFNGTITLEITVTKPTIVYPYIKFGQIFWFTTHGESNLYTGKYQNQEGPTMSKFILEK
jgi:dCTP deaminase